MFEKGCGLRSAPLPRGERQGGVCQPKWCGPQRSEDPVRFTDGRATATLSRDELAAAWSRIFLNAADLQSRCAKRELDMLCTSDRKSLAAGRP